MSTLSALKVQVAPVTPPFTPTIPILMIFRVQGTPSTPLAPPHPWSSPTLPRRAKKDIEKDNEDDESQGLACALAEGLARLMLHQELQFQMPIMSSSTGTKLPAQVRRHHPALMIGGTLFPEIWRAGQLSAPCSLLGPKVSRLASILQPTIRTSLPSLLLPPCFSHTCHPSWCRRNSLCSQLLPSLFPSTQDAIVEQVLSQLLQLQVHPASDLMPAVRQMLTVFFEARGMLCKDWCPVEACC